MPTHATRAPQMVCRLREALTDGACWMHRKSKEKQQVVKALYSGNKMMMMRESLGIVTDGQGGAFASRCVKQLFERAREALPDEIRHVYTAIDPTGGGPSKFAIVSGIRFNGKLQVCLCMHLCTLVGHRTLSCMRICSGSRIQ